MSRARKKTEIINMKKLPIIKVLICSLALCTVLSLWVWAVRRKHPGAPHRLHQVMWAIRQKAPRKREVMKTTHLRRAVKRNIKTPNTPLVRSLTVARGICMNTIMGKTVFCLYKYTNQKCEYKIRVTTSEFLRSINAYVNRKIGKTWPFFLFINAKKCSHKRLVMVQW